MIRYHFKEGVSVTKYRAMFWDDLNDEPAFEMLIEAPNEEAAEGMLHQEASKFDENMEDRYPILIEEI